MAKITYIPYAQQQAAIDRQRKFAELLQQQAQEPLVSQQVSGIVVPTSPWLGLAKMLQAGLGGYYQGKAAKRESEMKEQARKEAGQQVQDFISALGPQKGYEPVEKPAVEARPYERNDFATDEEYEAYRSSPDYLKPVMVKPTQWSDETGQYEPVYDWKETTKPGLSRNEALARLLQMKQSDNPYLADATSILSGVLPKEQAEAEYGTPFESGGKMYTMDKQGNVKALNLAAPTKESTYQRITKEWSDKSGNKYKQDYAFNPTTKTMEPIGEAYLSDVYHAPEGSLGQPVSIIDPVTGKEKVVRFGSRGGMQELPDVQLPKASMTESQALAGTFADRVRDTESTFSAGYVPSTKEQVEASIPLVGNKMVTDSARQFMQAERNFINAVLRRESGASISPAEFDSARKQYIPQPGDDKKTLEMKARNRSVVLSGLTTQAGKNYVPFSANVEEIPAGYNVVWGNQ